MIGWQPRTARVGGAAALLACALAVNLLLAAEPSAKKLGTIPTGVQCFGRVWLWDPGKKTSVEAIYLYTVDEQTSQGELTIQPAVDPAAFKPFRLRPEVGQQLLDSIYPVPFGDMGDMIVANWGCGATARKLTVFRLGPDGGIDTAFEDVSRFGFEILNVADDPVPDIVGGYGDPDAEKKQMKVFSWNGRNFAPVRSAEVRKPHCYQIVR